MFEHIHESEALVEAADAADRAAPDRQARHAVREAFFRQLERQCFMRPGPDRKRLDALKAFCWREWHSSGYGEVCQYYVELTYLLEPKT